MPGNTGKSQYSAPEEKMNQQQENFFRTIITTSLNAILDRSDANPDYPFINTKLSTATGEEFDSCSDPYWDFRKSDFIYSWIQGRGLEALTGHLNFLPVSGMDTSEQLKTARRINNTIKRVIDGMENLRAKNNGRLWFIMHKDGTPVKIEDFHTPVPMNSIPAARNYSELFYFKGLFSAASAIGNMSLAENAAKEFELILKEIQNNSFHTDQQPFDPNNPVTFVPGKRFLGPKMIAIGGLANFMNAGNSTADWHGYAARFIEEALDHHVNSHGKYPQLMDYGFIEAVKDDNTPYVTNEHILGDPGHACEFSGLAGKCLKIKSFVQKYPILARRMNAELPEIVTANFALGFSPHGHGICKSVDLITGTPVNTDMPWWNLPETMRAATLLHELHPAMENIFNKCFDAFSGWFVNPKVHCMAFQNRSAKGDIVKTIPATPDADPGYHTNLSLIDVHNFSRQDM